MQQRLPSLLHPPLAFAHRGARARLRENTHEAFTLAVELGATGIESDVWRTADGVLVLDHDGVVRSGVRKRALSTLVRQELPSHIPELVEVIAALAPAVHVSLDLKEPGIGAEVLTAIASVDPARLARLWLCSPDLDELVALRDDAGESRLVHSTRLKRLTRGPERHAADLAERGVDAVNFHYSDWTGGLVTLYHRFERLALAWDLQYDHVLVPLVRMGIDGVFSDHVEVMCAAVEREAGAPGSEPAPV